MEKQTFFKKLTERQFDESEQFYRVLLYTYEPYTRRLFILIQANVLGDLKGYQAHNVEQYPSLDEVQKYTSIADKLSKSEVYDMFYAHLIMLDALKDFQN